MNKITYILALSMLFVTCNSFGQIKKNSFPKVKYVKFGKVEVNGEVHKKDVVINHTKVRDRKKGPSKPYKAKYGHTPLTQFEKIPWDCDTLVIGNGVSGRMTVTEDFKKESKSRGVILIIFKTKQAIKYYNKHKSSRVNAILHITC